MKNDENRLESRPIATANNIVFVAIKLSIGKKSSSIRTRFFIFFPPFAIMGAWNWVYGWVSGCLRFVSGQPRNVDYLSESKFIDQLNDFS